MTAAERARRLDATVNDLRLALLNPSVTGGQREWLKDELDALRLARAGVYRRGQRGLLRWLGIDHLR